MAARTKTIGWVLAAASAAIMVVSVLAMKDRLSRFNEHADFPRFRFDVVSDRKFEAFGQPVQLTDVQQDGLAYLRIEYGGKEQLAPVTAPPAPNVPSLGIYDEWVSVLEVHEVVRDEQGKSVDKPGSGKVVLISRLTPPGLPPETWGSVFKDSWTFDFNEFHPDGTVTRTTYRWPRSSRGEKTLAGLVAKGDERAKALAAIPPLKERTWEYQAALHVMPKLNVPSYRFGDTAMQAVGWTMPAAGFACLGLLIGLGLALAPARRTGA